MAIIEGGSVRAGQRQLVTCNRALQHHIALKAKQLGRAPGTGHRHLAGFFHQRLLLDQAAKVLLVQASACQRLYRLL